MFEYSLYGKVYMIRKMKTSNFIQQRQKLIFFSARDIYVVIARQDNVSAFSSYIFFYMSKVNEEGVVHTAEARIRQHVFEIFKVL